MVHPSGTKRPDQSRRMTTLAYTTDTRELARQLEQREFERRGDREEARRVLARHVGCAPGTLETLRKGRLKRIEGWFHDKLEALLVREIEAEIRRLTRELEAYRRAGGDPARAPQVARLVAAIAQAQRLIGEETLSDACGERAR